MDLRGTNSPAFTTALSWDNYYKEQTPPAPIFMDAIYEVPFDTYIGTPWYK